ncbi:serine/threonine protein kinase [Streptomyces sp. NBC_00285]|uniref:serine/threonine-protein kinase n=1 Tax=Streptomyces sp. NBC_00285 TaxID=2975700 RepID=UPI002E291019|nr:serine/threonine-protein kinase [Streptomyces sp. NBC_00285]
MSDVGGSTDPKGLLVGGRYRLVERIGSGGMGTVWRARDELVGREVAVKQPRLPGEPEDEAHRRAAHRLHREARAAARVEHPCAVTIHDVVVEEQDGEGGLPWIVMELVRGESLHEALRRGPLGPSEAARIGLAVLGALRAAHSVGIVHRDVKPANVLLGPHGRVVLTDFGIAQVQGEESLTASGEFVGSLEYVAPERMSGTNAGPPSDLWSLGALLYAAVDGRAPFRRTTPEATLAAILTEDPPEPEHTGPLTELIAGLLARKPEQRPGAEEVARVLAKVSGDTGPDVNDTVAEAGLDAGGAEAGLDAGGAEAGLDAGGAGAGAEPDASRTEAPAQAQARPVAVPEDVPPTPAPEEALTAPLTAPAPTAAPTPRSRPRALLRLAVGPVGILLAGGIWLGTSFADGTAGGQGGWVAHREENADAVLYLPRQYHWMYLTGEAADSVRQNIYGGGDSGIRIRLTEFDKAPGSPLDEARDAALGWEGHQRTTGQYTPTSFHGAQAALSDVTYDPRDRPTRVMQLIVRTDDDRMYQLRVDMPKGTPEEKKGTALFKGARDRLEIGRM